MLKNKLLFLTIFFICYYPIFAQNSFIDIGDKQIRASSIFSFEQPNNASFSYKCNTKTGYNAGSVRGDVDMLFGKTEEDKIAFIIKVPSISDCQCCNLKSVLLFLDSGKTITVQNPFYQDRSGNILTGFYYLTTEDTNLIKESDIRKIKCNISNALSTSLIAEPMTGRQTPRRYDPNSILRELMK